MKCPKCHFENAEDTLYCGKCGTRLLSTGQVSVSPTETFQAPKKELTTGSTFAARYQIIEEVGKGGMGKVYKVFDKEIEEKVALKLLKPEIASDEEMIQRFRNEIRVARKIVHKNVCRMYDLGQAEGTYFITMEFVEGEDLKSLIRRIGQLPIGKSLSIARQVCEGLAEAHKLGIVHRDLKPHNIMVDKEGNARIMDFGIARSIHAKGITGSGVLIGTPEYMSPEQVEGKEADQRSDIYALGVILYEMVTGKIPFAGDTPFSVAFKHKTELPKNPKELNPQIPEGLSGMILRCLEKERERRYQSPEIVLSELNKLEKGIPVIEKALPTKKSLTSKKITAPFRLQRLFIPAFVLVALVVCFFALRFFKHQAKVRWAREKAIPEIMQLINEGKYPEAFKIGKQAEKFISQDPMLAKLWPEMSREVSIETDPPQADIFIKVYKAVNEEWDYLGKSPTKNTRIPVGFFRWKIEKQGFRTIEAAGWGSSGTSQFHLDQEENLPPGMVRVPGGKYSLEIALLNVLPTVELEDFLIDKHEVTNRQFKEFADKGGYQKRECWKYPFERDGKASSWEEAMSEFRDTTGRPGPATWELGTYPEGKDEFPVTGISWYEAVAYAEFAGKSLPTIYHWILAAGVTHASHIIPLSNFEGKGPSQAGDYQGLGPFGTYDLAGNVREWCWNESKGLRYIMGGAWEDPPYLFNVPFAKSPFDRSASNGVRCIKNISFTKIPEIIMQPVPMPYLRDFSKEKPVSDEIFAAFKNIYSYDRTDLNPVVEATDEGSPYWKKEKISYNAAYGNERIIAYLFLPKNNLPPYQTVIYFPGSAAVDLRSSENLGMSNIDYIIKSGRAALYPVYKSTYERGDGFGFAPPQLTLNSWRDHVIFWYKDLARSVDYLETRLDIDSNKLAYFGYSWGAQMGNILLALEKRIKTSILLVGGFIPMTELKYAPEADYINFAARVTIPTLMLNGKYDYIMPVETSQKPMFHFLGTPVEHKRYIVYESDHYVPRNELIKETLNWLDQYLGPVK